MKTLRGEVGESVDVAAKRVSDLVADAGRAAHFSFNDIKVPCYPQDSTAVLLERWQEKRERHAKNRKKGVQEKIADAIGLVLVWPPRNPGNRPVHVDLSKSPCKFHEGGNHFDPLGCTGHAVFAAEQLGFTHKNGWRFKFGDFRDGIWTVVDNRGECFDDAELSRAICKAALDFIKRKNRNKVEA